MVIVSGRPSIASTLSKRPPCTVLVHVRSCPPKLGDDHLGYLLRWTSLLNDHTRALALSALRPDAKSICIPPRHSGDDGGGGGGLRRERSRYYRALWRHAVEVVLRVS